MTTDRVNLDTELHKAFLERERRFSDSSFQRYKHGECSYGEHLARSDEHRKSAFVEWTRQAYLCAASAVAPLTSGEFIGEYDWNDPFSIRRYDPRSDARIATLNRRKRVYLAHTTRYFCARRVNRAAPALVRHLADDVGARIDRQLRYSTGRSMPALMDSDPSNRWVYASLAALVSLLCDGIRNGNVIARFLT